jgi:hypothetical protein
MQLWWAHNAMDGLLTDNAWNSRIEWGRFIDAWVEHRAALAQRLTTKNFLVASAAFTGIEQISLCRTDDPAQPTPSGTPSVTDLVRMYDPHVQLAKIVLNRASFGWWEWWIRRDHARRSQQEAESRPRRPPVSDTSNIAGG